jgi:hypothetical protein
MISPQHTVLFRSLFTQLPRRAGDSRLRGVWLALLAVSLSHAVFCQQHTANAQSAGASPEPPSYVSQSATKITPLWNARYAGGSLALQQGEWLLLGFASSRISTDEAHSVAAIPVDEMTSFEFSSQEERESSLEQGSRSGCSYARAMMPDLSMAAPQQFLAVHIRPGRNFRLTRGLMLKHAVRLVWSHAGTEQSLQANVISCEYQSLIANVRWMLGSRWSAVAHEMGQ